MVNVKTLVEEFRRRFPHCTPEVIARAPGRVNLIGEHVDYNGGLVMPFAIPLATWVVAGRRDDDRVVAQSLQSKEAVQFDAHQIGKPLIGWGAYVQGVLHELQVRGLPRNGINFLINSDVPSGAGLSSSAALEAAVALAAIELFGPRLTHDEIADACRAAEHDFALVPCGIMDQIASVCSRSDHVMLLNCRNGSFEHIPWPRTNVRITVVDSRSPHKLSTGDYALRVRECELVRSYLKEQANWFVGFREASLSRLAVHGSKIHPTIQLRRARHVITEIARVRDAADALRRGDFPTLGRLMNESHQSLAEDYEVSTPQVDALADCIRKVPGVFGARLTGAGFGGCVVAVAEQSAVNAIESAVRRDYDPHFGVTAPVWTWHPSEGATVQRLDT